MKCNFETCSHDAVSHHKKTSLGGQVHLLSRCRQHQVSAWTTKLLGDIGVRLEDVSEEEAYVLEVMLR